MAMDLLPVVILFLLLLLPSFGGVEGEWSPSTLRRFCHCYSVSVTVTVSVSVTGMLIY